MLRLTLEIRSRAQVTVRKLAEDLVAKDARQAYSISDWTGVHVNIFRQHRDDQVAAVHHPVDDRGRRDPTSWQRWSWS